VKQGHYIKNCRSQGIAPLKYTKKLKGIKSKEEIKGTQEYTVKHFTFYSNSIYQIHKKAKYSASYWPKELKPDIFKGTGEEDQLNELDKDLIVIYRQ